MPFYDPKRMKQRLAGKAYSTAEGVWVTGQRLLFGVMKKPAGTGSRAHRHPNEQFILVQQGRLKATIDGERRVVSAGRIIHIPPNALHSMVATDDADVTFVVAKDASGAMAGVPEDEDLRGAYIGKGARKVIAKRFRRIAESTGPKPAAGRRPATRRARGGDRRRTR